MTKKPDLKALSKQLPEECIDAVHIKVADGEYRLIASTERGLYIFDPRTGSWEILK